MAHILIIDDDPQVSATLARIVQRMNHVAEQAGTLRAGLERLEHGGLDLVFLDVRLPDGNGLDALPRILGTLDRPEVIILTGMGDPDGAELAIKAGVWDYLVKPSPLKDTMLTIERALAYRREKQSGSTRPDQKELDLTGLSGRGPAMRASLELLAQAAHSDAPALVTGETGTGKELFARIIHRNSRRAQQPFVVVDCAALAPNLVEATLFGHRRGAFTGADRDAAGLVRLAHGGTLFLDEVGEMNLSTQKAFLRVLQEKRFRPVGEVAEVVSDFRLIAATNRDLNAMVAADAFRQDLYFRLKTLTIHLPPLRQRPEDIRSLASFQVDRACARMNQPTKGFAPDFFDALSAYPWPGNVRELFNVLETALAACGDGPMLYARHLPSDVRVAATRAALSRAVEPGQPMAAGFPAVAGAGAMQPARFRATMAATDGPTASDPSARLADATHAPPQDTPPWGDQPPVDAAPMPVSTAGQSLKDFKAAMEHAYLSELMERTGRDVDAMAAESGLSRSHLYALLKKYGLVLKKE